VWSQPYDTPVNPVPTPGGQGQIDFQIIAGLRAAIQIERARLVRRRGQQQSTGTRQARIGAQSRPADARQQVLLQSRPIRSFVHFTSPYFCSGKAISQPQTSKLFSPKGQTVRTEHPPDFRFFWR